LINPEIKLVTGEKHLARGKRRTEFRHHLQPSGRRDREKQGENLRGAGMDRRAYGVIRNDYDDDDDDDDNDDNKNNFMFAEVKTYKTTWLVTHKNQSD
jgi:hypothetical protein